jgi:regulator of sigma E protease
MNIGWYALWFIVAVSLLVTVHEFGHFWVARRLGFKVLRFSVGFGRPLLEHTARDGTVFAIAAIPLGGYVRMLDEREGPVPTPDLPRSFTRKPPWQRILVLLAGPAFNIVFAILVLWAMLWAKGSIEDVRPIVGTVVKGSLAERAGLRPNDQILAIGNEPVSVREPTLGRRDVVFSLLDAVSANGPVVLTVRGDDRSTRYVTFTVGSDAARRKLTEPNTLITQGLGFDFSDPPIPAAIGGVAKGGAADKAGLRKGDVIVDIDGRALKTFHDLADVTTHAKPGDTLAIRYLRDGSEHTLRLTVGSAKGPDGKPRTSIGVQSPPPSGDMLVIRKLTPVTALTAASAEAWNMTTLQARLVWRMMIGQVSLKNLNGPLSIAEFAGESASGGTVSFLSFLVLISLSLGFLNLLPIPILDGGQIVYQVAEWLKGSPVSEQAQVLGQQVGIALLILMMGVALFNDIARQIG